MRVTTAIVAAILLVVAAGTPALADPGCLLASANRARAAAELPSLAADQTLAAAAARHAAAMAAAGRVFHSRDLAGGAPPGWTALAENVGAGPDCTTIAGAFLISVPHRSNLLGDFVAVGIGTAVAGDGTVYVAQIFMDTASPPPDLDLPVLFPAPVVTPPTTSPSPAPVAVSAASAAFDLAGEPAAEAPPPRLRAWIEPAGNTAFLALPWGFLIH